jgi:hypothetical protein
MRAKTVNFERGEDPMKTMSIGKHREMSGQQLIDQVFDNIYDELKDDPKFSKEDHITLKDDIYSWILAMIEDENLGETGKMSPDEITADQYRNFYEDIIPIDEEEPDWDDMMPEEDSWEDED